MMHVLGIFRKILFWWCECGWC